MSRDVRIRTVCGHEERLIKVKASDTDIQELKVKIAERFNVEIRGNAQNQNDDDEDNAVDLIGIINRPRHMIIRINIMEDIKMMMEEITAGIECHIELAQIEQVRREQHRRDEEFELKLAQIEQVRREQHRRDEERDEEQKRSDEQRRNERADEYQHHRDDQRHRSSINSAASGILAAQQMKQHLFPDTFEGKNFVDFEVTTQEHMTTYSISTKAAYIRLQSYIKCDALKLLRTHRVDIETVNVEDIPEELPYYRPKRYNKRSIEVSNKFIKLCGHFGDICLPLIVFHSIHKDHTLCNTVSYSTMMCMFIDNDMDCEVLKFYRNIGALYNHETELLAIKACININNYNCGYGILQKYDRDINHVYFITELKCIDIESYGYVGDIINAKQSFDTVCRDNKEIISIGCMMKTLTNNDCDHEARDCKNCKTDDHVCYQCGEYGNYAKDCMNAYDEYQEELYSIEIVELNHIIDTNYGTIINNAKNSSNNSDSDIGLQKDDINRKSSKLEKPQITDKMLNGTRIKSDHTHLRHDGDDIQDNDRIINEIATDIKIDESAKEYSNNNESYNQRDKNDTLSNANNKLKTKLQQIKTELCFKVIYLSDSHLMRNMCVVEEIIDKYNIGYEATLCNDHILSIILWYDYRELSYTSTTRIEVIKIIINIVQI